MLPARLSRRCSEMRFKTVLIQRAAKADLMRQHGVTAIRLIVVLVELCEFGKMSIADPVAHLA